MTSASHVRSRKRWLTWRKTVLGLLVFVLAVVIAHLFWGAHERRKFMADIQRYQAAGEPVLPEDFARLQISGPDDPVAEWLAAAGAVNLPEDFSNSDLRFPLTDAESKMLREIVQTNTSALAHAKAASRLHGTPDWKLDFTAPTILIKVGPLTTARHLSHLLGAAAMDAHQRGDDAEAVERIIELLAQRNALSQQPGVIAHLVGLGVSALACDRLERIVPDLRIAADQTGAAHPASPVQVRQLISALLDEKPFRDGQRWALLGERLLEADTSIRVASGTLNMNAAASSSPSSSSWGPGFGGYVLRPLIYADGRLCMQYVTSLMPVAQSPDYPTCRLRLQVLPNLDRLDHRFHPLAAIMLPAANRLLFQDFRTLTTTRLAATELAARWYADEHEGRFPDSLNDLVPNYLPAVPADPMAPGAPLRYRNGPQAIVYSVGDDGIDDGGSEQHHHPGRMADRWDCKDVVIHLTPQPRPRRTDYSDDSPDAQETPQTQPAGAAPSTEP